MGQVRWRPVIQYPDGAGRVGLETDGTSDRGTPDPVLEAGERRAGGKGLGTVWHWNHTLLRDLRWKPEAPLWLNLPICNWKLREGSCPAYWALGCIRAL